MINFKHNLIKKSSILFTAFMLTLILTSNLLRPVNREAFQEFKGVLNSEDIIIDCCKEDSTAYLLVSSEGRSDYADLFVVLRQEKETWKKIYVNDFENLHPWKLTASDVDGDGIQELLIAVNKTSHYEKELKNRLYVMNFENGVLTKKWVGSQFAGEWNDFYSGDLLSIPGNELIFIEKAGAGEEKAGAGEEKAEDGEEKAEGGKEKVGSGEEKISIYYWFDFGFIKLAESDGYKNIQSLSILSKNRIQITYGNKQRCLLTVKDGVIVRYTSGD